MEKKVEVITINNESNINKIFNKYLRITFISLIIALVFLVLISISAHLIVLRNIFVKKLDYKKYIMPAIIISNLFYVTIILFILLNFNRIKNKFKKYDYQFNSLINSMDLFIINLKSFLENISNRLISQKIKDEISVLNNVLDNIIKSNYDYDLCLSFVNNFIIIQTIILEEISSEKNQEINKLISEIKNLSFLISIKFKEDLFSAWSQIIENPMHDNISKLSLGIESIQKMQNQFNKEINAIENKLNNLNLVVNNITRDNTINIEQFFESFNKINQKIYKDFDTLQNSFSHISKDIEIIDELSKDISVLAFNIEIEAAKMKESKVFTVLAKEVRNFSNQLSQYYSSINSTVKEIKKFISNTNYNDEFIQKNISNYLSKIELLCNEYDRALNEIKELNQKLISQNRENQKIFIEDVSTNLQILQKLAIELEQLEHRNTIINSLLNKSKEITEKVFNILNLNCEESNIEYAKSFLNEFEKLITTKDEIELLKVFYKKLLNTDYSKDEIDISNKYKSEDNKDEGIIIF